MANQHGKRGEENDISQHDVVIAGGGPTGLMLAAELALAGLDVVVVERRASQEVVGSRAGGLHARSLEILDQRGVADRFLAEGQTVPTAGFGGTNLDLGDIPTRHNYTLGLWQRHIERILGEWVDELAVTIHRRREVTGFTQDPDGVEVTVAAQAPLRARYLVGCDGGRSLVRKAAGIGFEGWDATTSSLIAQVQMTEEPPLGIRRDASGTHALGRMDYEIRDGEVVFADEGPVGVLLTDREVVPSGEPTLQDVQAGLVRVYGTDFGAHAPISISRFNDSTRQATAYRDRRVFLAGDAAHVHAPNGGQGLNLGLQDAVNLGWKLARVVKGRTSDSLLDTYHAERHPVAARVLRTTMAQVGLSRMDERTKALGETVAELLTMDEPRRRLAARVTALDLHYDLGEGHPLLGRRMPDVDVVTEAGKLRVFEFLHEAQPVLLDLDRGQGLDLPADIDGLRLIRASYSGEWELPVLGQVTAPTALLIRPDGYVAWVGQGGQTGLAEALASAFGR